MATYDLGTARGIIEMQYNGKGIKDAEKDVDSLQKKGGLSDAALKKTGRAAGVAGLAIAGGFALAVGAAANFEQKMSGVEAVSGASAGQMDQLRDKALQLGKDTQFSASEAASGIEELVKAGISIPDVLNGAADAVTALAAAGGIDLATAATISSNAMNAFGIKAKDMGGVVDNIAGAANASAIDVGQFGESLQQVGAVAHLAGVNFKDTATAIAIMGNAGIKGSDAGTSLKTMFQRLQPTTVKQINTMESLGILSLNAKKSMEALRDNGVKPLSDKQSVLNGQLEKLGANLSGSEVGSAKAAKATQDLELKTGALSNAFYTQDGRTKSLAQVSQVLQDSLKGMNERQKQMTLNTLFGSDAIRGAAILSESGSKGFDKMAKSMDKVSAADVAKKRMDNLKGSIEQMKGSLETAGIVVGTLLLPALRDMVDGLTGALNTFLDLPGPIQGTIAAFIGIIGVMLLVLSAIVKFIQIQKAIQVALAGTKLAFISTWAAALGPIALIVLAIAAVIIILVVLYHKSELARKIMDAAFHGIQAAAEFAWNWIKGHWPLLLAVLGGPVGLAAVAIIKNFDKVVSIIKFVGSMAKWLWNNAFQPALKLIVQATAVVINIWAKLLGALAHVPGFGWVKGAAEALGHAADTANALAESINKIPPHKESTIVLNTVHNVVHTTGGHVPALAEGGVVRRRAGGTLVQVGEGGSDEAIVPLSGGIGEVVGRLMMMLGATQHAARLAGAAGSYATPSVGSSPKPRRRGGGGDSRLSRVIDGELRLHPDGRAFIRGVAEDAMADNDDYGDTTRRMG